MPVPAHGPTLQKNPKAWLRLSWEAAARGRRGCGLSRFPRCHTCAPARLAIVSRYAPWLHTPRCSRRPGSPGLVLALPCGQRQPWCGGAIGSAPLLAGGKDGKPFQGRVLLPKQVSSARWRPLGTTQRCFVRRVCDTATPQRLRQSLGGSGCLVSMFSRCHCLLVLTQSPIRADMQALGWPWPWQGRMPTPC